MNLLKIAWRNLWRNKRRTIITASSLYFAVVFAIFMRSMQLGTYDLMIDAAVRQYSGFIQLQNKDFWTDKSIDDVMTLDSDLQQEIQKIEGIRTLLPRIESFALASYMNKTKGIIMQGIDPEQDLPMTHLDKKLVLGKFIQPHDSGVVLSQKLSEYLQVTVGDTLVMISQGYHGATAAALFPIRGIVKMPNPLLDARLVITSIDAAQRFYGVENSFTSMVVDINDQHKLETVKDNINKKIKGTTLIALSWLEMNKELKQQIESDNGSGLIMLGILYMVIFFGVFGTIIMLTTERHKEFAIMVSIGMKRFKVAFVIIFETLFIGAIGIIAGFITTIPIIYYFSSNPIRLTGETASTYESMGFEPLMGFSTEWYIFLNQMIIVYILLMLALIYPILKISSFKLINALKS